jgi:hypothetical protein
MSEKAPDGQVWMCTACGQWSKDRRGVDGPHSREWDKSCMLNAILVDEETLEPVADPLIERTGHE